MTQVSNAQMQKEADWIKTRNAYFAFGVVVWGYIPDASWVLENINLDTWYDLGFCVAHTNYMQSTLKATYENSYRKDMGIASRSFKYFFDDQTNARLPQKFDEEKIRKSEPVLTIYLTNFLEKKAKGQARKCLAVTSLGDYRRFQIWPPTSRCR